MKTNKEILKKRIIYRSEHRGSKEMDLILGNFVKRYINNFNDNELKDLQNLIFLEDEILQKWFFEKNDSNLVFSNKVSQMFKKFKL